MDHFSLKVTKTAHYYTLGKVSPEVQQLWIVCHGYAQLADEFLQNFKELEQDNRFIIAPEGLSHFYKKGFDGPVAATWMTRHFRESEISDYCAFLQTLYEHYTQRLAPDVRVVLLGFSQGVATICRWIIQNQPRFQDLLLWAGLPPEDLDYAAHKDYLSDKNLYLLYGTNDPFLTPDRLSKVQDIETRDGIDFEAETFTGGHEILPEKLREILLRMN